MVRLLSLLLAGILIFSSCTLPHPEDPLNEKIEKIKAVKDFRLFRDILQKAHPALTQYISRKRLNFLFDSVYESIEPPVTLREFYNKLSFLVNEIGCSHTYTSLPAPAVDTLFNRSLFFPFPVIYLEGALIANSDFVVPHGTKILSINSLPVTQVLDSVMIYNSVEGIHRETQKYLTSSDFSYDYFVRFGGFKQFELLVKDTSGYIHTIFPKGISLTDVNDRRGERYYFDATDVPYYLHLNNTGHYALMRISTFEYETGNKQQAFENFLSNSFELLAKKPAIGTLIVDLRENSGGELYNCFLLNSYICHRSFPEYKAVSSRIDKIPYPDLLADDFDPETRASIDERLKTEFTNHKTNRYEWPDSLIGQWSASSNRFLKKVYIITNYRVASAASYFALLAKYTGDARIVGVETSGGNFSGNGFATIKYTLPWTGISFQFAYANMIYSFGGQKAERGIIPDYTVPDNYTSFKNNTDEQIDFIKDSLISK